MLPADGPEKRASGRVLVTGATGFLGRAAADALAAAGHQVVRGARAVPAAAQRHEAWVAHGDLAGSAQWDAALDGVGTVVHCAGLAHLPDATAATSAELFARVNTHGTAQLAAAAAGGGVTRFVLISTALVHGRGRAGRPFSEADAPVPETAYARSKLEAERRLQEIARGTGMRWTILRPPMVYGPGAGANFRRLVGLVQSGWPIPLGAATAPKSFLGIDNLVSAVARALEHPGAADKTFLVGDAEQTSTADLVCRIAAALGRRARMPAVPPWMLRPALQALGKTRDFDRLFEPLALDAARIRRELGWQPPLSLDDGLRRAVAGMTT